MIKLIKFGWAYFKLYRYETKKLKYQQKLEALEGKSNALRLALTQGYTKEIQLAKHISQITKLTDKDRFRNMMVAQKERNKKIIGDTPRVGDANIFEVPAITESGDDKELNELLNELGTDDGKN